MSLEEAARAILDGVTAVVLTYRWPPSEVWEMELWELSHWMRVAKQSR